MARTVLITGCSGGFGRQLAERLGRAGDKVVATMRGVEGKNAGAAAELRGLAETEGFDLEVVELDVASSASVDAAAAAILERAGTPDAIYNNAGQMFTGLAESFSPEELAHQLDVNVVGVHRVLRAFLPRMRARGSGLIVNVSSVAGRFSVPFFAIYHASKWALEGYSVALRAELASSGVDVVLVEPGPFTTNLFPNSVLPADPEGRAASYPAVAHASFEGMGAAFEQLFEDPETPTDPELVVDCMAGLLDMPAGTRPLRSVVGVDFGVRGLNDSTEPFQAGLLEEMGLTAFTTMAGPNAGS